MQTAGYSLYPKESKEKSDQKEQVRWNFEQLDDEGQLEKVIFDFTSYLGGNQATENSQSAYQGEFELLKHTALNYMAQESFPIVGQQQTKYQ